MIYNTENMNQLFINHSDLSSCFDNNGKPLNDFCVVGEILSDHHDEGQYFWLLFDTNTKKYHIYDAWHDYTGWDCQSGANLSKGIDDLSQFQLIIQEFDNQNRPVRQILLDQAKIFQYNQNFDVLVNSNE